MWRSHLSNKQSDARSHILTSSSSERTVLQSVIAVDSVCRLNISLSLFSSITICFLLTFSVLYYRLSLLVSVSFAFSQLVTLTFLFHPFSPVCSALRLTIRHNPFWFFRSLHVIPAPLYQLPYIMSIYL